MFNKNNFCHIASNNRNEVKVGVFVYKTTDDLETVLASGYFNDKIVDINLHDLIIHEWHDPADRTKVQRNVLCVTERTLDNVGTAVIKSKWEGDIEQDVADLQTYVDNTFVRKDGTSIMTGPLKLASGNSGGAIAGSANGLTFYRISANDGGLIEQFRTSLGYLYCGSPSGLRLGSSSAPLINVYTPKINNGYDISVPATSEPDTLALKSQVDDAANSGTQLYETGVWYAKMHAETVVPVSAEVEGRNYADFSQLDQDNNPVIVVYEYTGGAWTLVETITPPANYNGYMTITSKIWDIQEQAGQQGGLVLWAYSSKRFTPYPRIVSTDSLSITNSSFQGYASLSGTSTVVMPDNPGNTQIVNKDYVDTRITSISEFELFDFKWRDATSTNAMWLLSDNEWKTHINGYRHLSEEYVEVKWTTLTQSAELGNKYWHGFVFTGSKYVAVGRDGYVSSSNDGTTWATATYVSELGTNNYWFGLAFNGSKFVAISNLGYISTSTDGNTWTTATWVQNIANGDWYEIVWGNGKFVAVGNQGHVSTSTNGTTWSATASSLGDHGYHALAFNGSKFVALSIDGWITESTDGVNWSTPVQDPLLKSTYDADTVANWWSSLVWDGYRFVAATRQYYSWPVYMATSEDGITWTRVVQDNNCTGTKIWDGTKIITMTGEGYLSSYTPVRDVINGTAIYYSVAQDGHKIITPDQVSKAELVYAATGASWYYVLDVTNSRFKLPKINPARAELGISAPVSGSVADLTNSTTIYCGKKYLYFYVGV